VAVEAGGAPARQQLIRSLNEQLLLDYIRGAGKISRPDLARMSRLSKPTVSLALANLERAGLIRTSGIKTGAPGRAALLYEVHPETGYVLALDAGSEFLRGAVSDLSGAVRARSTVRTAATTGHERVAELHRLAKSLCADAGIDPADVTHINAHGTSTALNDAAEAEAITAVFGPHRPAVTSIKGVTGHSLGASGGIEAVALALTYAHRTLPPTMGTVTVDAALDIDVVLSPQPWTPAAAISNSFGFGGHNGTLVFRPV
jgi:3-oxoacyl-(acyl-carrier-protein) synthase